MDNQRTDNEKLKELAEKIKADGLSEDVKKKDGAFEFSFTATLPKTALVFEESDGAEGELDFEEETSNEEQAPPKEEIALVERSADEEEFDIPDMFVISDEYNDIISDDNDAMIWKTYVPRFTEVTERQYRLRDDNADPYINAVKEKKTTVSVSQIEDGEMSDGISPSSERLDERENPAVIVNINAQTRENNDTINFYKFSDTPKAEATGPSEEELEKARISALTGHKWQERHETEEPETNAQTQTDECIPDYEPIIRENTEPDLKETYSVREIPISEEEKPSGAAVPETEINGKSTTEFNSFSMREFFKDKFLDVLLSTRLRLAVSALIALITLVFENIEMLIPGALSFLGIGTRLALPAVYDAALTACAALVVLPEIIKAVRAGARAEVAPECSLILSLIAILIYDTVMITSPTSAYPLFGFVYSVMALCAVYATYCLHNANFEGFKIISEKEEKQVLDIKETRTLERENIALDGAVDEYKSRISRVFRTSFVSDFFKRSAATRENSRTNLLSLAFSLGVAIVCALVMFFLSDGITSAASTLALVIVLALPAFSLLLHKMPYNSAQREAVKNKSAIIGEGSLAEYSAVDVVAFRDTEIFGEDDVVFKSISLSDREGDFRKTMKKMSSLFTAVGGPLDRMFLASVGKRYPAATDLKIEDDGISGIVDGKEIMAGTADYMRRRGVSLPRETAVNIESTRTMYAAEDGAVFAKFAIQYSFSEAFAMLLPELRENKIVPLVYTKDPNITTELMRFLTGQDSIRVMREYSSDAATERLYRRISAGLVTKRGKDEAISLILLSKRYNRIQKQLGLTELSAVAVGAALGVAISVCNMTASLPSVLLGVWQLAWCVALAVVGRRSFDSGRRK